MGGFCCCPFLSRAQRTSHREDTGTLLDKRSRAKTTIFLRRNYTATLKAASQLTGGAHQAAVLLAVRCKRLQLLPGQVITELGPNTHSEQGKQRRQHWHDSSAFDSAAPSTPHRRHTAYWDCVAAGKHKTKWNNHTATKISVYAQILTRRLQGFLSAAFTH